MADSTPKKKLDRKAQLAQTIEQAKAKLSAIESRESAARRKLEARGAIVFSGYVAKASPVLLDQAISSLEGRELTDREKLDLQALKAYQARKVKN